MRQEKIKQENAQGILRTQVIAQEGLMPSHFVQQQPREIILPDRRGCGLR